MWRRFCHDNGLECVYPVVISPLTLSLPALRLFHRGKKLVIFIAKPSSLGLIIFQYYTHRLRLPQRLSFLCRQCSPPYTAPQRPTGAVLDVGAKHILLSWENKLSELFTDLPQHISHRFFFSAVVPAFCFWHWSESCSGGALWRRRRSRKCFFLKLTHRGFKKSAPRVPYQSKMLSESSIVPCGSDMQLTLLISPHSWDICEASRSGDVDTQLHFNSPERSDLFINIQAIPEA